MKAVNWRRFILVWNVCTETKPLILATFDDGLCYSKEQILVSFKFLVNFYLVVNEKIAKAESLIQENQKLNTTRSPACLIFYKAKLVLQMLMNEMKKRRKDACVEFLLQYRREEKDFSKVLLLVTKRGLIIIISKIKDTSRNIISFFMYHKVQNNEIRQKDDIDFF